MADPMANSGARDSYGYTQLRFEPLGGGVVTALGLPFINRIGAKRALVGTIILTLVTMF